MPRLLIFFGKVAYKSQMTLLQAHGFAHNIMEAVNPDTPVSRYGRTWRVSQPIFRGGFMLGKLGFMSSATETKTYYDEKRKDFVEQPIDTRQGHYVQWVIDLSTQMMAFEARPPAIKYQSFIGALGALLNERPDIGLTIEGIVQSARFFEWARQVDRITRFTARLRTPNPDFSSRPKIIRELLEDTNADSAKVEVSKNKESNETLDTGKTISDLVKYGEDGYSTIRAHGLRNGSPTVFDSKREMPVEQIDVSLQIGVDTIWAHIMGALRKFRK